MDQSYGTPEQPKKKNTTLIVIIVILVVLCLCCVATMAILYFWLGDIIVEWLRQNDLITQVLLLI